MNNSAEVVNDNVSTFVSDIRIRVHNTTHKIDEIFEETTVIASGQPINISIDLLDDTGTVMKNV